jgi:hypothetical protein
MGLGQMTNNFFTKFYQLMKTKSLILIAFLLLVSLCAIFGQPADTSNMDSPEFDTGPHFTQTEFLFSDTAATNTTTTGATNQTQEANIAGAEYGLVGIMALGVLGLLTFVVKQDRHNMTKLTESIDRLRENSTLNNAQLVECVRPLHARLDKLVDEIEELKNEWSKKA